MKWPVLEVFKITVLKLNQVVVLINFHFREGVLILPPVYPEAVKLSSKLALR